jgi:hypothetical protein
LIATAPAACAARLCCVSASSAFSCDKGLWCRHPAGQCKVLDGQRKCDVIPRFCTREFRPVRGCGGKTYGNDCTRRAARAQLAYVGKCKKTY